MTVINVEMMKRAAKTHTKIRVPHTFMFAFAFFCAALLAAFSVLANGIFPPNQYV